MTASEGPPAAAQGTTMKRQLMAVAFAAALLVLCPAAAAQDQAGSLGTPAGWGVLTELGGRKFVWNSGRARGSDATELTFHEFQWRGNVLAQTQCSYWPLRNLRAVCGTHLIERQPDGSLLLKANGGKPYFKGTLAADGSVEFVNKTLLGSFVTAFIARPDRSVALMHRNRVDGERQAPLIPIDAAREAGIMGDMQSIYAAAEAQRREEAERRYDAFMGAMAGLNTVLSAATEVATANEARSRAELDRTMVQAERMTLAQAAHGNGTAVQVDSDAVGVRAGGDVDAEASEAPSRNVATSTHAQADETFVAAAPLRFVMSIGLRPRAGDSVNPTCYSNVITRPGPPGWGQRSLPPGSSGIARDSVQGLKARFIAACTVASGRQITSAGNFEWTWNESRDAESRMDGSRARFPEDVTVAIQ